MLEMNLLCTEMSRLDIVHSNNVQITMQEVRGTHLQVFGLCAVIVFLLIMALNCRAKLEVVHAAAKSETSLMSPNEEQSYTDYDH